MKKLWIVGLTLATALAIAPAGRADSFYFTLSNGLTGGGVITGNSVGNGEYAITGGSVTIDGMSATIIEDPYSPSVAYDDLSAGGIIGDVQPSTDSNWFSYDNILTPNTSPYLLGYGILFQLSDGAVLEIFGYDGADYWNEFYDGEWAANAGVSPYGLPVTIEPEVNPVPEPAPLLMLGTGLLILAGLLFRKAKPGVVPGA